MKKTPLLLLLVCSLVLQLAKAQDTTHVTVCTKFWKTGEPITATKITATVTAPGFPTETSVISLDSSANCAAFEFIASHYPANAAFAFSAAKDQDGPLNGVNTLDMIAISRHILGLDPLPAFGMIAGDVNGSHSVTTFDIVETRKIILGLYSSWPNAPIWRFIPDYSLPFFNPSNPFQGQFVSALNLNQLQALNNDTIVLTGTKTGDVNGDAITTNPFWGPGSDSLALKLPDLMLEAGVPVTIPITFQQAYQISGLQLQLNGIGGAVMFDTITIDPAYSSYLSVRTMDPLQRDQIRAVLLLDYFAPQTTSITLYVHLTANTAVALKDALQIQQSGFYSFMTNKNNQVYRLYFDNDGSVDVHEAAQVLQLVAATPNPFGTEAQVQIALSMPESVLLEILDISGKLLFSEKSRLPAGMHYLKIPGAVLPNNALVFYRITAGQYTVTGKLVHR